MDAAEKPFKPTPEAAPLICWICKTENVKGKSINLVALLSLVLIEPTYLQLISNAMFSDPEMKKFIELAQGLSPIFELSTVVVSRWWFGAMILMKK